MLDARLGLKNWISEILPFDLQNIFLFKQNDLLIPAEQPFIILQEVAGQRVGWAQSSHTKIFETFISDFQVDFYRARELAHRFYLLISGGYQPDWGGFTNIAAPLNNTDLSYDDRYMERYTVLLSINYNLETDFVLDTFEAVEIQDHLI